MYLYLELTFLLQNLPFFKFEIDFHFKDSKVQKDLRLPSMLQKYLE